MRPVSWYTLRLVDIVRREGICSLWFRALSVIGYRRVAYLECPLVQQPAPDDLAVGVSIRLLDAQDAPTYVRFRNGALKADFLKRLDDGRRCYAAFTGNRIASVSWIATGEATLWLLLGDFELKATDCYFYDSFTHTDFRGMRLQSHIFAEISNALVAEGFSTGVTFVVPENRPNLRSRGRQGFTRRGFVRRLRVGPWIRFFSTGQAPSLVRHCRRKPTSVQYIHAFYQLVPDWLDRAIVRMVNWLLDFRQRYLTVEHISGTLVDTNSAAGALAIGRDASVEYHLSTLFKQKPDISPIGQISIEALVRDPPADDQHLLTIIRCQRRHLQSSLTAKAWQIPDAVASIVDLRDGIHPDQRGNADNLRRIRRFGLYPAVSHRMSEFFDFYRKAYLPFVNARFGSTAVARSESRLARQFRRGGLLWVECDGVRLAGMLFSRNGEIMKSWVIAPLPEQADAWRMGALGATYKFLIDRALAEGCRSVDLGMSRSALLDGVLMHKKHWGARLAEVPNLSADWLLDWHGDTNILCRWLARSPLIVRDEHGLAGLTAALDGWPEDKLVRHLEKLASPGLSRIFVMCAPTFERPDTAAQDLEVCFLAPGAVISPVGQR